MEPKATELARLVAAEVENFQIPEPHPLQLGSPLSPEWFEAGLAEMRQALVPPFQLDAKDYDTAPDTVLTRTVWIVADDTNGTLLAYDPTSEGDFALVWRHPDQDALSNIRGDAVGCFLSR
ncbi:MAG TPA: hypothetical protein VGG92_17315 [Caulobacteraceae bacterium]|jgi:hypothetical protein